MTGYGRTGRELSQSGTPSRAGRGGVLWRPALLRVPLLRGSTLVETLVMMLVAGIVFLTVMDGMTLFTRLQVRRAEALLAAGRKVDGYYRTLSLITAADSVCPAAPEWLTLYGGGRQAELILRDSVPGRSSTRCPTEYACCVWRSALRHPIPCRSVSGRVSRPGSPCRHRRGCTALYWTK